jgi:hypothetical protein
MPEKNHKHITCQNCVSREKSLFDTFCTTDVGRLNKIKSCSYFKKKSTAFY